MSDKIDGLQLVHADNKGPLKRNEPLFMLALLKGRCIGKVSMGPDAEGNYHWSCLTGRGVSGSQAFAIASLIEQDYYNPIPAQLSSIPESEPVPQKEDPTTKYELLVSRCVDRLRTDREIWRIAELELKEQIKTLKADIENLQNGLKEACRDRSAALNQATAHEEAAAAMKIRADRAYWLGQQNGFSQARDLMDYEEKKASGHLWSFLTSVRNKISGWEDQAIENVEHNRPMPSITAAVEADREEREKRKKQDPPASDPPELPMHRLVRILQGLHLVETQGKFCTLSCNANTWEEIGNILVEWGA